MASKLGDDVLDRGLQVLNQESNAVHLVSATPNTYTEATSTYSLGVKVRAAGEFFYGPSAASPNGRKVTLLAIEDGTVTANGTALGYAVVTTTANRLDANANLTSPLVVYAGDLWTLQPLDISIPNQ